MSFYLTMPFTVDVRFVSKNTWDCFARRNSKYKLHRKVHFMISLRKIIIDAMHVIKFSQPVRMMH